MPDKLNHGRLVVLMDGRRVGSVTQGTDGRFTTEYIAIPSLGRCMSS